MTWILLVLCVAVGGRELFTAYERRQQARRAEADRLAVEELRSEIAAVRAELADAMARADEELRRDRATVEQDRLARQDQAVALAELAAAVDELHADQAVRLERESGEGTALPGLVQGESAEYRAPLTEAYARCLGAYGLRIDARRTVRSRAVGWTELYHLTGDGLAWLPRALLGKARARDDEALQELFAILDRTPGGALRIGAFAAVRTPAGLLYGIASEGDGPLRPEELAEEIRALPRQDRCALLLDEQ